MRFEWVHEVVFDSRTFNDIWQGDFGDQHMRHEVDIISWQEDLWNVTYFDTQYIKLTVAESRKRLNFSRRAENR